MSVALAVGGALLSGNRAMIEIVSSPLEGSTLANVAAGTSSVHAERLGPPPPGSTEATRGKATRTYTGAALARRQAWGKEWAQVGKQWKTEHANEGK